MVSGAETVTLADGRTLNQRQLYVEALRCAPTDADAYFNLGRLLSGSETVTLADAVRKLSGLPAANLGIARRGIVKVGNYADLAIFDPAKFGDTATFAKPQSYAVGMRHVFVNGVQVLKDGEHTGAKPGRVVAGPGTGKCVPRG
jgi:N-acyl-D-amino-acid deacylase